MPITASAKKALRVSRRRRVFNLRRQKAMKEAIKRVKQAAPGADAAKLLAAAYQAIDKAKKRGVIKANAAARQKSQLAKALAKLKV